MSFLLSKIAWVFASPGNFLTLLLAAGTLWAALSGRRRGFGLITAAAVGFLALTALPVGEWLLVPLENRFAPPASLPPRVDGIVVLGGVVDESVTEVRGQIQLSEAGERLVIGALLARRYKAARVVLAGGNSRLFSSGPAESDAMRTFFVEEGVEPARIVVESRSRTTYENAVFARELAMPKEGETWLLVSSAAHMPRAVGTFRGLGWAVLPYPVDYRTTGRLGVASELSLARELALVATALREWAGLVLYRLAGRTDALLPGPS